jgi:hypothetical protein
MDQLIQANLELHEELGKEVRINLENEAKIKRLERQQVRYEKDIQYLYSIIEKLESQKACDNKELHSLKSSHLKTVRLCDEKEKFILFLESQLSESENTIFKLRKQNKKMASSSSTKGVIAGSCENIRESLAVFYHDEVKDLTPAQLRNVADNITTHQGHIEAYSENLEKERARAEILQLQAERDLAECTEKKNTFKEALEEANKNHVKVMEEAKAEYASLKGKLLDELTACQTELKHKDISVDGLVEEMKDLRRKMNEKEDRWAMGYDEFLNRQLVDANERIERYRDNLADIIGEAEVLEENCTLLADDLQRNLDRARRDIVDKEYELDLRDFQIKNLKNEKAFLSIHYRAEQTMNRSLARQRLALKIANRQLQIRLINPPIQPANQTIWLLLQ